LTRGVQPTSLPDMPNCALSTRTHVHHHHGPSGRGKGVLHA
jgi:hypothetical protein